MARATRLLVLLLAPALAAAQNKTYIALGDSLAFGFQPDDYSRGSGDKGYVRQVADWIGTKQGGVRPLLINLAVPGETSGSFYDTSEVGALLNSNYPIIGRKSQAETFKSKVAQQLSQGRIVTHVSFALGGNDLLGLLDDQFLALPYDEQRARVDQALAVAESFVVQELTLIRLQLPAATLVVPGYYNPYGAFPGTPVERISSYALPRLNQMLVARSREFFGGYAETYSSFVGRELQLTWIAIEDVHPNDAGYEAMAEDAIARLQRAAWRPVEAGAIRK